MKENQTQPIRVKFRDKVNELSLSGDLQAADTIIVIAPGFFGYGSSIAEAKKNCIAAGAKKTMTMKAYLGDKTLGVTDYGDVTANAFLMCLGEI